MPVRSSLSLLYPVSVTQYTFWSLFFGFTQRESVPFVDFSTLFTLFSFPPYPPYELDVVASPKNRRNPSPSGDGFLNVVPSSARAGSVGKAAPIAAAAAAFKNARRVAGAMDSSP
eukprot:31198-Pelagococcus_subviridis.AAC.69